MRNNASDKMLNSRRSRRDVYYYIWQIIRDSFALVRYIFLRIFILIAIVILFCLPCEARLSSLAELIRTFSLSISISSIILSLILLCGSTLAWLSADDAKTEERRAVKFISKYALIILVSLLTFNYTVVLAVEVGVRVVDRIDSPYPSYSEAYPPDEPSEDSPPLLPLHLTTLGFLPAEFFSNEVDTLVFMQIKVDRAILGLNSTPLRNARILSPFYMSTVYDAANIEKKARAYFNEHAFRGMRYPLLYEIRALHVAYKNALLEAYSLRSLAGDTTRSGMRTYLNEMEKANYQKALGDIYIRLGMFREAFSALDLSRVHFVNALQLSLSRNNVQDDAIKAIEGLASLYGRNRFLDEDIIDITLSMGVTLEQMQQTGIFFGHLLQAVGQLERLRSINE